jgi:hypothetical protein
MTLKKEDPSWWRSVVLCGNLDRHRLPGYKGGFLASTLGGVDCPKWPVGVATRTL